MSRFSTPNPLTPPICSGLWFTFDQSVLPSAKHRATISAIMSGRKIIRRITATLAIAMFGLWCLSFPIPLHYRHVGMRAGLLYVLSANHQFRPWGVLTLEGALTWQDIEDAFGFPGRMRGGMGWVIPFWSAPLWLGLAAAVLHPQPRKGHCRCGYNLQGNVSGVCPECGITIHSQRKIS